ncbi:MAG: hypothetical protein P8R42_14380 [Candidatus Binatia bacterium]|nr:hypothetical protein [Candidatus Binatia bacterium]
MAKCTAADFGCAPTGTCIISGTHDIGTGCHLDWGTQNVEIRGTLRTEQVGDSFSLTGGQIYLDGGKLTSTGNNVESGGQITITASGRFWMAGSGSRVETSGNAGGGSVVITANDVLIAGGGAIITDGGVGLDCGPAGDVTLSASGGQILLGGNGTTISAATTAYDCDGGFIVIDAPSLAIYQGIDGSGGAPPGITLVADPGDIFLASGASLDARGRGSDEDFGNNGGDIELDAAGRIDLQGSLNSEGSGGDGSGGDLQIDTEGSVTIGDDVDLAGVGTFASGGVVEITALGDLSIAGNIDVSGGPQGDGGTIDALARGDITVASGMTLTALGGSFGGGFIDLITQGNTTIDGDVIARGTSTGSGGFVDIRGCQVSVSSTIDVEPGAIGIAGFIDLTGGTITLTSTARLESQPCASGDCNTLSLRSGAPSIDPGAFLDPAANIVLAPSLAPCCGNGVLDDGVGSPVDVGEECEDGNGQFCDSCTPSCMSEPSPPCAGDGNECTQDCSPSFGCAYQPLTGVACDDEPGGNVCTTDICDDGACTHRPNTCDDGVDCTIDSCDPILGCQAADSDPLCNDGEECTTEICDPASGDPQTGCVISPVSNGTVCDDESVCTSGDECQAGACVPSGPPLECDDGDECTFNNCDDDIGCINSEDASACDCLDGGGVPLASGSSCVDGNDCTVDDTCDAAGGCVAGQVCPDDGDPCTAELCAFGVCLHPDTQCLGSGSCVEGQPCSDGDSCTLGTCLGGQCEPTAKPCSDGDDCTGIEACSSLLGCRQFSQPPIADPICDGFVTDAFTCYRARRSSGTPAFLPIVGVAIEDEFWTRNVDVTKPAGICLPTNVAGSDPDAVTHEDWVLGYKVRSSSGQPKFVKQFGIEVTNALGTVYVDAKKPDLGFAPTAGDLVSPPAAPTPPDPDYFSCYKVGRSQGTPKFQPVIGVTIEDALGTLTVDVKKPMHLCNPANVSGLTPGAAVHATHLLCYQVRISKQTPGFTKVSGIHTANLMGTGQLDAPKISELCLPSSVTVAGP